jgi:hypothetical protein
LFINIIWHLMAISFNSHQANDYYSNISSYFFKYFVWLYRFPSTVRFYEHLSAAVSGYQPPLALHSTR